MAIRPGRMAMRPYKLFIHTVNQQRQIYYKIDGNCIKTPLATRLDQTSCKMFRLHPSTSLRVHSTQGQVEQFMGQTRAGPIRFG